jgi:hypothetical protein
MKQLKWMALAVMTALVFVSFLLTTLGSSAFPATPETALPAPAATLCPVATPEPLWVDPVTSPTDQFTQVITVYLGNGEAVTIVAESGTFTTAGSFGASSNPALVNVALLSNMIHHLRVFGTVRVVEHNGCFYGGYTLETTKDRFGAALVIEQQSSLTLTTYFPLVLRGYLSPTGLLE